MEHCLGNHPRAGLREECPKYVDNFGLKDVAERAGGALRLSSSSLYAAIKRLLGQGLIEELSERPDPEHDDERRRYYRLDDRKQLTGSRGNIRAVLRPAPQDRVPISRETRRARGRVSGLLQAQRSGGIDVGCAARRDPGRERRDEPEHGDREREHTRVAGGDAVEP